MKKYLVEVHFRYGKDQKDFERHTIIDQNEQQMDEKARALYRFVFAVMIISIDGIPAELDRQFDNFLL